MTGVCVKSLVAYTTPVHSNIWEHCVTMWCHLQHNNRTSHFVILLVYFFFRVMLK